VRGRSSRPPRAPLVIADAEIRSAPSWPVLNSAYRSCVALYRTG